MMQIRSLPAPPKLESTDLPKHTKETQMKKIVSLAALLTFGTVALSQQATNPCDLAFPNAEMTYEQNGMCTKTTLAFILGPTTITTGNPGPILQALQVKAQLEAIASQRQLAISLTTASELLARTSEDLKKDNVSWRKDVLDKTVATINQVPSSLATNQDLVRALAVILAADQDFRDKLAIKKN